MKETLLDRKRKLVHDAIYEAAIDLFFDRGFEETTIEEITDTAGVSRRSFFRYFENKDDLLAQSVVDYGRALRASIETCPASASPLEVLEHAVLDGIQYVETQRRIFRAVDIATRSTAARRAISSRFVDVDEMLTQAYATRIGMQSANDATPRLMSGFTSLFMNVSIVSWFNKEQDDLGVAAREVVAKALHLITSTDRLFPASQPKAPEVPTKKKSTPRVGRTHK